MYEYRQEKTPNKQSHFPQQTVEQSVEKLAGQVDPLIHQISQVGRVPSPLLSAALRDRTTTASSSCTHQLFLHLQRQYGNHYVQRVVDLSRQGQGETEAPPAVEAAIEQARGGGRSLDTGARIQMESTFGADFSGVRIHTDSTADTLNQALSARAFTTGQDIFFRQGEYNPASSGGRELLAHELTHVVQQTGGIQPQLTIGQPGDIYEQEADQVAHAVVQRLAAS
ncbi:MAG: DUF4157 domain-containing protein [Leptolyngbyaceae cyanobacterium RU_5_1]|nr:DUF4157 domain-containing protein [Leptolyngbyaceae cyanobacterium RU_5_1]